MREETTSASTETLMTGSSGHGVRKVSAFGLKSPPPSQHLKKILENYPEGSQIFKEALQNADDAYATTFCILLDQRTHRSPLARLDQFMGPSLVFYNDGVFTQDDWQSLQNMFESKKSSECGSIGKFGMGSRCYYHMTDILTIVSGHHIAYLDPDWILSREGGELSQLPIEKPTMKTSFVDALTLPLSNIFGFNPSYDYFQGTLFRLPLRMGRWARQSTFAPYEYSVPKTRRLLEKFQSQAAECLIFLQSVQKAALWRWLESEDEPFLCYCCRIRSSRDICSATRKHEALHKRGAIRAFLQNQQADGIDLKTSLIQADTGHLPEIDDIYLIEEHDWMSDNDQREDYQVSITKSKWILNVCLIPNNDLLSYLEYTNVPPSIGLAALLCPPYKSKTQLKPISMEEFVGKNNANQVERASPPTMAKSPPDSEEDLPLFSLKWAFEAPSSDGARKCTRNGLAFCFLPLPDVETGLPVHIHGTFVLTDNRRSFWMALNDTEGQAKKWSEWNICLIKQALPELYIRLLTKVASLTNQFFHEIYDHLHQGRTSDDEAQLAVINLLDNYYDLWPDPAMLSPHLNLFLTQFSHKVKTQRLILRQPNLYPSLSGSLDQQGLSLGTKLANFNTPQRIKQFAHSISTFRLSECSILCLTQIEDKVFEHNMDLLFDATAQCQALDHQLVWLPDHIVAIAHYGSGASRTSSTQSLAEGLKKSDQHRFSTRCKKATSKDSKYNEHQTKTIQVLEMYYTILLPYWVSLSVQNLVAMPHFSPLMLCLCKILGQGPDKYIEKFKPACADLPFVPTRIPGVDCDENDSLTFKTPGQCFDPMLSGFKIAQLAQPILQFRSPDVLRVLRAWGLKQRLGWAEIAQEAVSRVCVVGECQPTMKYAAYIPDFSRSLTTTSTTTT